MEAAPAAPLIVPEPEFLLELLVVALDAPAQLGQGDKTREGDVFRQGREPALCRFPLLGGPLDQKPLLRAGFAEIVVAMRRPDSQAGKARGEQVDSALAPRDRGPRSRRQGERNFLG